MSWPFTRETSLHRKMFLKEWKYLHTSGAVLWEPGITAIFYRRMHFYQLNHYDCTSSQLLFLSSRHCIFPWSQNSFSASCISLWVCFCHVSETLGKAIVLPAFPVILLHISLLHCVLCLFPKQLFSTLLSCEDTIYCDLRYKKIYLGAHSYLPASLHCNMHSQVKATIKS